MISLGRNENHHQKVVSLKAVVHPTTFPNIATFALVVQEDIIWEVQDNFQKQTYRNRYHICNDQGLHKLSIPIKHIGGENGRQKYKDVKIDNSYPWQLQHWRTLQTSYRTSPFFEFYEDELAPLFDKNYSFLLDYNWASIDFLIQMLQVPFESQQTASYEKQLNAEKDYRFLVNAKKEVAQTFESYHQVFGDRHGFIPNSSTLDLLFNEGPNAVSYLKKQSITYV